VQTARRDDADPSRPFFLLSEEMAVQTFLRRLMFALGFALAVVVVAPAQEKVPAKAQAKAPARPTLPDGTTELTNLAYVADGGPRRTLDLYLPKADGPLPLIIWVHGGGWEAGSKENPKPLRFLSRGYAVASINYRLSQMAPFPAQIQDCKAAVRHLRLIAKENNIDPDRFGAWGESAGGHLVALLGTCDETTFDEPADAKKRPSARVQAVCDWYGPSDFATFLDGVTADRRERLVTLLQKLFDGPLEQKKELMRQASPTAHVSKSASPFLIVHGDKDPIVMLQQSELLHAALTKVGVESTLQVVPGGSHGGPGFDSPETRAVIEQFFDKHLKKSATANSRS
jgi:acetyl esterase/lipase